MEANAALRTIVRRDSGETYREMLTRMAEESGVETPTIDDLVRLDRKRKGKKLSNRGLDEPDRSRCEDRLDEGRLEPFRLLPEHAVDLDTGVAVAASIHSAEAGDTATLGPTLEEAQKNLAAVGLTPTCEDPSDLGGRRSGYQRRDGLKALDGGPWKTRIAELETRQGLFALAWRRRGARGGVWCNRAADGNRASASRPCASAAKWSSAASPMFLIGAACAARGCAVARTFMPSAI